MSRCGTSTSAAACALAVFSYMYAAARGGGGHLAREHRRGHQRLVELVMLALLAVLPLQRLGLQCASLVPRIQAIEGPCWLGAGGTGASYSSCMHIAAPLSEPISRARPYCQQAPLSICLMLLCSVLYITLSVQCHESWKLKHQVHNVPASTSVARCICGSDTPL